MSMYHRFLVCLFIFLLMAFPVTGRDTVHLFQDPITGEIYMQRGEEKVVLVPGEARSIPEDRPGASFLPPPREEPASKLWLEPEAGWEKVFFWSGEGNMQTEAFSLGRLWRIRWVVERKIPELSPRLSILIKSPQGMILNFPVTSEVPALGVTDSFEAGSYTLSILSTGLWSILIEEKP